jgi:flagellar basal body-associated protein FliL
VFEDISINEFDYFRVAEGRRRKSFIIFVVIIAVVLIIAAAAATLAFVFTKKNSIQLVLVQIHNLYQSLMSMAMTNLTSSLRTAAPAAVLVLC